MNNYDFKKIVNDYKDEIVSSLQELLRIKSVYDESTITPLMPFGKGINDALNYMLDKGQSDGFTIVKDEGYAGSINYGSNGKTIGVLCHLDVVPEGSNWTYPPYEAKIVDGKIFARGTTDDKGPTMACYYALKIIKEANIKLKNKISLILGTDEETGWRGVKHYFNHYPMPEMGFAPDCSFPLVYGEKGRMAIDLTTKYPNQCAISTDNLIAIKGGERYNVVIDEAYAIAKSDLGWKFLEYLEKHQLKGELIEEAGHYKYIIKGKAAHAMEPEKGINAGTYLCDFFKDYTNNPLVKYVASYHHLDFQLNKLGLAYNDYEMGPLTCNIGIIDINEKNSRVTLDIRYPERYNQKYFEEHLKDVLDQNGLLINKFEHKVPHYVSPDDDLVKLLYQAYVNHTQDTTNKPFTVGGGTYASMMKKAVAFGMEMPGEIELAHQPDECLNIDTLLKGILIYIDAILALGEIDA